MDLASTIRDFIRNELLQDPAARIDAETPILERGYLTSLQTVELVVFLEERLETPIDPEEVTEDNFQTVAAIAALVERKRGNR